MREEKLYRYYSFGYNYYLLQTLNEGIPFRGTRDSLKSRIKEFIESLEEFELNVTRRIARELNPIFADAIRREKDETVDRKTAKKVTDIINKLDPTLDAEMQLKFAYILTPKRYSLELLLKHPENIFAKNTFKKLTPLTQFDFKEGLKCIAFSRSTAAAFHVLRATEGMIKELYYCCIKQHRIKNPMWYGMVDALKKKKHNKIKKEVLDHLDMIRDNFRNPTQHPEKFYDIDEAQDLLNNCIGAVNNIVKEIDARSKNK